jgi:hypothetical protein
MQSGGIERKQSVESAGSAVTDNGLPADGPGPEVNNDAATLASAVQDGAQTSPPSSK